MHQIGVGVLGPVFRAYDPDDDRVVAVKAFHLDITPELASTLAAALNAIVQAGVVHPSLVTPVGAGLTGDVPYLASEYVAAESLDVAIRRYAPAAVGTALPCVVQLAEAIDTAHAGGLCHGALHLRDVFATPDLARVTGFGVVSALDRVRLRGPLRRPYTAPERIADAAWGPAADRFALAAIAYELLTGKRLAGTGEQVTDGLAGLSGVRDVASLTRLFAGALADTPATRPASARLFADELVDAVGWNGAGAVRQALSGMNSAAGDLEHQSSHDAPAIAVSGVSARPSAGVETAGTEGAALNMARTTGRESAPKPALDWTERKLDRGESDELREREAYQPRPPGVPPEVQRTDRATVPDFDRIDAALEHALDDAVLAAGDDGGREAAVDRRIHAASPTLQDDDPDRTLPPAGARVERPPSDGAAPTPSAGSLFDQLDPEPGARAVHAGRSSVSDAGARQPDDRDAAELDDGAVPAPDDDDDDVDLSVVQARYRPVDDDSEPSSDAPDSQAAGVYAAITLSELQDRLEDTDGLPEDDTDDDLDLGADLPAGPEARDDDVDARADRTLMFESDAEVADDRYRHDDPRRRLVAWDWLDRARELPVVPLALIGVVLTGGAFAVGFGLMVGGDDVVTDELSAVEAVAAGGLADASDALPPAEPAPQVSREFGAANVAGSPVPKVPVEARTQTPPAQPTPPTAVPAPVAPTVPKPAGRPAPVTTTEAPGAPVPRAPTVSAPAPSRPNGRLLVRSTPPGVRVEVNGDARGTTPLALADLSYGAYDVRFSLEGFESQDRRLAISADDPIAAISAELARVTETRTASLGVGSIFVDTRPRGVEVWIDQRLVGETPMLIPNVSAGVHEVEFRHDGYRDWATNVQVGSSSQARVTASLDHVPR